ncbi:MAG: hypothetical protein ABL872_09050 [Lacibacter sp.]
MRLLNIIFISIVFLVISCTYQKKLSPSITELKEKNFLHVELADLVMNKSSYHGKYIETNGFYTCGFENSSIRFVDSLLLDMTDSLLLNGTYFQKIWVEGHPRQMIDCDSLNNSQVIVKGLFDTSGHGHMGFYLAEIKYSFLSLKKE